MHETVLRGQLFSKSDQSMTSVVSAVSGARSLPGGDAVVPRKGAWLSAQLGR